MSFNDLKKIGYEADGLKLTGYLAQATIQSPRPGILIAHEAPGVGELVKERAQRLSKLGYVAFVLDMYGGEEFSLADAMAKHKELVSTPGAMRRRARAALNLLAAQPGVDITRLACIGFCQGGMTAMELARDGAPIKAAVGFHPGLTRPAGSDAGPINAKILMMVGADDPIVTASDRSAFEAEMTASGADWQLLIFGGVCHSYTSPAVDALGMPGLRYSESADRRSWAAMLALFEEIF